MAYSLGLEKWEDASLDTLGDLKLAQLAACAYDAARSRAAAPRFIRELCDAFDGVLGFLTTHDCASGTCELLMHDAPMPAALVDYAKSYCRGNPWLAPERICHLPHVDWCGEEIVPEPELVQTEFYRSWLKPHGLRYWLAGTIAREGEKLSYVALLRPSASRPFDQIDKLRLRRLIPYLQAARRVGTDSLPVENGTSIALEALEHLPFGVIALDGDGKVCYASTSAGEMLNRNDGLFLRGDSLRAATSSESARLSELIASVLTTRCGTNPDQRGILAISRPSGARPYVLNIFGRALDLSRGNPSAAGAVVFIHDPGGGAGMDGELLRTLYHLTPAEAKLAGLLSLGLSASSAAAELGITINTARTHLKRLYSKTCTSRQPELVRLLVGMMAIGSPAQHPLRDRPETVRA